MVYSDEETRRAEGPPSLLIAVPKYVTPLSQASVGLPITALLYNGPLLFGVTVAIRGLTKQSFVRVFSRFASLQAHGVQKRGSLNVIA